MRSLPKHNHFRSNVIMHEVEQGLVAFQTLLEHHTDIAFDFFEAWCLRNIFMIPSSDLPIVLSPSRGIGLYDYSGERTRTCG